MKKLLIVASISLLLVEQYSHADLDINQIIAGLNTNSSSNVGLYDASSVLTQDEGDADRLLKNLGEDPDNFKIGFLGRWTEVKKVIRQDCNSDGNNCTDIYAASLTPAQINAAKQKNQVNLIKAYFEDNFSYPTVDTSFAALHADIKALQKRVDETKSNALKDKLNDLLKTAKAITNIMKVAAVDEKIIAILNNFKPSKSSNRLSQALKDAEAEMLYASDQEARSLYAKVIKQLHDVKLEVEKIKKHHDGSIQDAIKKAEEELRKARIAHAGSKVGSSQYLKHAKNVDLYEEVVAELKLEAKDELKMKNKIEEEQNQVKSLKATSGNPRIALEEARASLIALQQDFSEKSRIYGSASSDMMKKKKEAIALQQKAIDSLEADIRTFPAKVNKRVAELLRENRSDAKAALAKLKITIDNSWWGTFSDKTKAINDDIDLLPESTLKEAIDKEAAKEIHLKMQGVSNSTSSMGYLPGISQQNATDNSGLNAILSQAGLSAEQLNATVKGRALKADLVNILQDAARRLQNITMSTQISEQQKVAERSTVSQNMATQVADRITAYKSGVSATTWQTMDPASIGIEYLANSVLGQ